MPRRLAVAAVAGLAVLALLPLYIAGSLLGETSSALPGQAAYDRYSSTYFPQGWAFFTRSPRTPEAVTFRYDEGEIVDLTLGPNARVRWGFGLNRSPRAQEFEIGVLTDASTELDWFACEARVDLDCVEAAIEEQVEIPSVENPFPAATICGDRIALIRVAVFPWAFANAGFDPADAVDEVKVLDVECPEVAR